jgi:hypothetical protein
MATFLGEIRRKLIFYNNGETVKIGDSVPVGPGGESRNIVGICYHDGTVALASPRGITHTNALAIGAAWVHDDAPLGPKPIPAVPSFDRLNAATKRIDERTRRWDKVAAKLSDDAERALDINGDAELAEALSFAAKYAQGQAATMLDITGMF